MDGLRRVRPAGRAEDPLERRAQAQVGEPGRRGRPRVGGIAEPPKRTDDRARARIAARVVGSASVSAGRRSSETSSSARPAGAARALRARRPAGLRAATRRARRSRRAPARSRDDVRVRRPAPGPGRVAHAPRSAEPRPAPRALPPPAPNTAGQGLVDRRQLQVAQGVVERRDTAAAERGRQAAPRGPRPVRHEPPSRGRPGSRTARARATGPRRRRSRRPARGIRGPIGPRAPGRTRPRGVRSMPSPAPSVRRRSERSPDPGSTAANPTDSGSGPPSTPYRLLTTTSDRSPPGPDVRVGEHVLAHGPVVADDVVQQEVARAGEPAPALEERHDLALVAGQHALVDRLVPAGLRELVPVALRNPSNWPWPSIGRPGSVAMSVATAKCLSPVPNCSLAGFSSGLVMKFTNRPRIWGSNSSVSRITRRYVALSSSRSRTMNALL